MEQIKVSIIVPVYNAERYLEKCIQSILNQTLSEIEVILVDDGSKDNSLSVCDNLKQQDERVQVIHQLNQGVSSARNIGMKVATGEFITFVDADDWIDSSMYLDMYSQATKYGAEAVVCNYIEEHPNQSIFKSHHLNKPVLITKAEREQFILNLIAGRKLNDSDNIMGFRGSCFYLYRREKLKNKWFQKDLPIGEDFVFNLNVLSSINSIAVTKEAYYHYCMNKDSAMQKYRKDCYEEQRRLIQAVEKTLIEYELKEQAQEKLILMKITYLVTRVANECRQDNLKCYREKVKTIRDMCGEESIQATIAQFSEGELTKSRRVWFRMYKNKWAEILYCYYRLKERILNKEKV